jgi:peroxiredoxin Q/BCP
MTCELEKGALGYRGAGSFVRGPMRLMSALAVSCALAWTPAAAAELEVGSRAPNFTLQGSDGKEYTLEGLLKDGTPGVVLAWFPKAFTSG